MNIFVLGKEYLGYSYSCYGARTTRMKHVSHFTKHLMHKAHPAQSTHEQHRVLHPMPSQQALQQFRVWLSPMSSWLTEDDSHHSRACVLRSCT